MEKSFEKFLVIDHDKKTVIYNSKQNIYGEADHCVNDSVKNMLMIAQETGYTVKTSFNNVIFSVTANMRQEEGVNAYSEAFNKKVKEYWQSPEGQKKIALQKELEQDRINNGKLSRVDLILATARYSLSDINGVVCYERALGFVDDQQLRKKEHYENLEEMFYDSFFGYRLKEAVECFKANWRSRKEKGMEDTLDAKFVDSIAASFGLPEFFDKNNVVKCKIVSPEKQKMTPDKLEQVKALVNSEKPEDAKTSTSSVKAHKTKRTGIDITD